MSILASELKAYAAASMPEDDTSTSGGAIDTAVGVEFTDIAATDNIEVLSDGADTRSVTIYGRTAAGAIVNEVVVLNGVTPVTSANSYERVLKVTTTSNGTRTVTVRRATGDTLIGTIGPNMTAFRRLFYDASSDPSATKTRYEKIFWKNTNGSLQLNSAAIKLTADPQAVIRVGCATAKNDSGSVANRLTAPGGVTFVDDNVSQSVPTGAMAAADTIGVWVEEALAIANAAFKNTFTTQLSGTST